VYIAVTLYKILLYYVEYLETYSLDYRLSLREYHIQLVFLCDITINKEYWKDVIRGSLHVLNLKDVNYIIIHKLFKRRV